MEYKQNPRLDPKELASDDDDSNQGNLAARITVSCRWWLWCESWDNLLDDTNFILFLLSSTVSESRRLSSSFTPVTEVKRVSLPAIVTSIKCDSSSKTSRYFIWSTVSDVKTLSIRERESATSSSRPPSKTTVIRERCCRKTTPFKHPLTVCVCHSAGDQMTWGIIYNRKTSSPDDIEDLVCAVTSQISLPCYWSSQLLPLLYAAIIKVYKCHEYE